MPLTTPPQSQWPANSSTSGQWRPIATALGELRPLAGHARARDDEWAAEDRERAARIEAYRRSIGFNEDGPKGRLVQPEVASWVGTITTPQDLFRREVFACDMGADHLELLCPRCAAGVEDAAPTVLFDARGYVCNRCHGPQAALEPWAGDSRLTMTSRRRPTEQHSC